MMNSLIWDEFGPEKVLMVYDSKTGMKGYLVIDNTARGMGRGGVRMAKDVELAEVVRLARTMTWKWAMANYPFGGAKGGIIWDPESSEKEAIVRAYARALQEYIPKRYIFGLDMGLTPKDAAIVVDELDDPDAASAQKPIEIGGVNYDDIGVTGYGVAEAVEEVANLMDIPLHGTSVALQGFGAVGNAAAKYLTLKKAKVVAISTVKGVLCDDEGLDVEKLLDLRRQFGDECITHYKGGRHLQKGEELFLKAPILVPCAKEDMISQKNVERVEAKLIVEGANMPVSLEAQKTLQQRGVVVVQMHMRGKLPPDELLKAVSARIKENTRLTVEMSRSSGKTPREVALEIAKDRVLKAMQFKGRVKKKEGVIAMV
jgi:glutamate dehydrogenase (NAD(P)+)